jgi:pyruvate,water dikinase
MNYVNILSHGAVVAREYGIPVVVFNGDAMSAFHDGDYVQINGSTGRIKVLKYAEVEK